MRLLLLTVCLALAGCVSPDAFTDVQKFRYYENEAGGGLEPIGYMTVREARLAGYRYRNGEWISQDNIRRKREEEEFLNFSARAI